MVFCSVLFRVKPLIKKKKMKEKKENDVYREKRSLLFEQKLNLNILLLT